MSKELRPKIIKRASERWAKKKTKGKYRNSQIERINRKNKDLFARMKSGVNNKIEPSRKFKEPRSNTAKKTSPSRAQSKTRIQVRIMSKRSRGRSPKKTVINLSLPVSLIGTEQLILRKRRQKQLRKKKKKQNWHQLRSKIRAGIMSKRVITQRIDRDVANMQLKDSRGGDKKSSQQQLFSKILTIDIKYPGFMFYRNTTLINTEKRGDRVGSI